MSMSMSPYSATGVVATTPYSTTVESQTKTREDASQKKTEAVTYAATTASAVKTVGTASAASTVVSVIDDENSKMMARAIDKNCDLILRITAMYIRIGLSLEQIQDAMQNNQLCKLIDRKINKVFAQFKVVDTTEQSRYENICELLVIDKTQSKNETDKLIQQRLPFFLQILDIVENYNPDGKGVLTTKEGVILDFTFKDFIYVLGQVINHFTLNNQDLFGGGIDLTIERDTKNQKEFYAKIECGQLHIAKVGTEIARGTSGIAKVVWDIYTRQILAMKQAFDDDICRQRINRQVGILNKYNPNGKEVSFERPPYYCLCIEKARLFAFVTKKFDGDMFVWTQQNGLTTNLRITTVQKAMRAFLRKEELGLWHNDIKPENFFMEGHDPKLADLETIVTYEEAAETFELSDIWSPDYISRINRGRLLEIQKIAKDQANAKQLPELKKQFIASAKSGELFSFAMTIFIALAAVPPFSTYQSSICPAPIPDAANGIHSYSLNKLKRMYGDDIVAVMKKMLAYYPENRYQTAAEAATALESIDPNTGRVTPPIVVANTAADPNKSG